MGYILRSKWGQVNSCEIESKINELETHSHFSADDYILITEELIPIAVLYLMKAMG